MADKKVTELGQATLPITGSEILPVVQGSASKQVAAKEIAKFGYQDIVTDSTAAKTLALADIGSWIRSTVASTITVPLNSTVAFAIGTSMNGIQAGSGQITIVGASGVTINRPSEYNAKTRATGAPWCLIKISADAWDLIGDLEAA